MPKYHFSLPHCPFVRIPELASFEFVQNSPEQRTVIYVCALRFVLFVFLMVIELSHSFFPTCTRLVTLLYLFTETNVKYLLKHECELQVVHVQKRPDL